MIRWQESPADMVKLEAAASSVVWRGGDNLAPIGVDLLFCLKIKPFMPISVGKV